MRSLHLIEKARKKDLVWGTYPERKEQIADLCKRIRPVLRFVGFWPFFRRATDGALRFIKPVDPFKMSFTWSPKAAKRARNLEKICDITTYHTWGYYGFFKPSVAEVIAQIPEEVLSQVVAFEIIDQPETVDDLNKDWAIVSAGHHVATTRLYRSR